MQKKITTKGIIRNKTDILILIKESKRKKLSRFSKENIMGQKELSYELATIRKPLVVEEKDKSDDTVKTMLPPIWIDQYQKCKSLLRQIDEIKKQMMTYQSRRFTVVKETEQKQIQLKIYDCATTATKKIKKCEKILDKIEKNSQLQTQADHKTCKSITYKLATALRQKTKEIRAQQRAFIEQRKNLQMSTKASFLQMAAEKALEDDYDAELMEENTIDLDSRNQQILKIVESIHQLNDLYKELNAMVILQGSLLDRIDFNIEQSFVKVNQGQEHIEKAEKYQKKTSKCACRTMFVLLIGITILGIILIVKWT